MKKIEILAPAGTFEAMQAAIRAGADAVYLGGGRFGARAYAGNLDDEQLMRAIDYTHLHGRKLYLTVNTLLKEDELAENLYSWLKPFYEQGLDAAIVQDLGVLSFLREHFPKLALHASTQMTVAGPEGARLLQQCGAVRIVTPRELSLEEIRAIRAGCDLEIESFVHGALCYCYSGQCLMSSMIGGRSGNRGRCAQPCRMNYRAFEGRKCVSKAEQPHLLSPKDMNTLAILPEIIEAGVNSLKIEGRMKKPVYTAGVTEIYRKYVDRYLEYGSEKYAVAPEDDRQLFDLFNRNGFHQSYYKQHNGKNMMALTEKEFRFGNEPLEARLQAAYLEQEKKEPLRMRAEVRAGQPVTLTLTLAAYAERKAVTVTVSGPVPQKAMKQPVTAESIRRQLSKLGNTDFAVQEIAVDVEDGLFLPLVQVNELRRLGIEMLTEAALNSFRRQTEGPFAAMRQTTPRAVGTERSASERKRGGSDRQEPVSRQLRALAVNREQAEVLLASRAISRIYIESEAGSIDELADFAVRCQRAGKQCYLAMPYVFRDRARKQFDEWRKVLEKRIFDGFLVRSLDELSWLTENGIGAGCITADCGLYSWNREAVAFLHRYGVQEDTVPLELNLREILARGAEQSEIVVYGRVPMMVSAQCVRRNTLQCKPDSGLMTLTDRMGERFPVRFVCRYCYNVIYNSKPLSYFTLNSDVNRVNPAACRLSFSTESGEETADILEKCFREDPQEFTRGHWKRGVE